MNITLSKMEFDHAVAISHWKYPSPYEIYSMDGSEDTIHELLGEHYYLALNEQNELVGYLCFGDGARVPGGYKAGIYEDHSTLDIGLGLHPDLTGQGYGTTLVQEGIRFSENYAPTTLQLVVASFNERAISVYEKAGFVPMKQFYSPVDGKNVEFLQMKLDIKNAGLNKE
ncbi:GNAT family N-acetyltransferase [Evansella sp. AB-rgal1]|uniref:GNAT family N-acetyltransferase n=1 Tax=Evansella sp. AB-rgal1 TaxID=3242696 RepID=UPI00359E52CC